GRRHDGRQPGPPGRPAQRAGRGAAGLRALWDQRRDPRSDRPRAEWAARRGIDAACAPRRTRTRPGTRAGRRRLGISGRTCPAARPEGAAVKLGTRGRYAVMAMVDLARHSSGDPVSLTAIAERQEISLSYLEQLFAKLRRSGLVSSVRGPGGGYRLAHDRDQIRI